MRIILSSRSDMTVTRIATSMIPFLAASAQRLFKWLELYRVAKTHRMPDLNRSFPANDLNRSFPAYDYWLFREDSKIVIWMIPFTCQWASAAGKNVHGAMCKKRYVYIECLLYHVYRFVFDNSLAAENDDAHGAMYKKRYSWNDSCCTHFQVFRTQHHVLSLHCTCVYMHNSMYAIYGMNLVVQGGVES